MKHHSRSRTHQPGHILVVVLLVMLIGIFTITMAASMIITTSQAHGSRMQSNSLRTAAESGVENAILNVLRDPAYTGETINIDGVDVGIVVQPGSPTTITATATGEQQKHVYRVTVDRINGMLSITSWTQIE